MYEPTSKSSALWANSIQNIVVKTFNTAPMTLKWRFYKTTLTVCHEVKTVLTLRYGFELTFV